MSSSIVEILALLDLWMIYQSAIDETLGSRLGTTSPDRNRLAVRERSRSVLVQDVS